MTAHEPLTLELVAQMMRDLLAAFPSRNVAGQNIAHTAEVYRNGLRGVSGEALRAAVDLSIKSDTYFPKIARLRELASEWTKRNVVSMPSVAHEGVCPFCHSPWVPRDRWRPAVDVMYNPIERDGFLYLEPFARDLCRCAPPCFYAPMSETPEMVGDRRLWKMRVEDVQREYKAWLEKRGESRRGSDHAA